MTGTFRDGVLELKKSVVKLSDHRPPTIYDLRILHHWDGEIEIWTKGIAMDHKANPALAAALRKYADALEECEG